MTITGSSVEQKEVITVNSISAEYDGGEIQAAPTPEPTEDGHTRH